MKNNDFYLNNLYQAKKNFYIGKVNLNLYFIMNVLCYWGFEKYNALFYKELRNIMTCFMKLLINIANYHIE